MDVLRYVIDAFLGDCPNTVFGFISIFEYYGRMSSFGYYTSKTFTNITLVWT